MLFKEQLDRSKATNSFNMKENKHPPRNPPPKKKTHFKRKLNKPPLYGWWKGEWVYTFLQDVYFSMIFVMVDIITLVL